MSAEDFEVVAIEIPNPEFYPPTLGANVINSTEGYQRDWSSVIQTISSNNPGEWDAIKGLLYVPDLSSTDVCDDHTRSLIPKNVTRYSDLPPDEWTGVAVAPWTSVDCVQSYLLEIRNNPPAIAAIFYHPDGSTDKPPNGNDPSWNLDDGGKWKNNPFPIYAVPGSVGSALMHALSLYSGNMTDVPHGDELVKMYDSRNFVRLYVDIDVDDNSNIPSLWVFLIIVLCILLAVVLTTSIIMHLFQARRRRSLQRRVARGEVDLEALGIKRLMVPQSVLDKMPLYKYTSPAEASTSSSSSPIQNAGAKPTRDNTFSQPTCPICLDDFVHNETIVRELPCNHIFHPECIDPFLRDNSSLCPMCKKSALPQGYCPVQVTNLMVRRERLVRRMRERLPDERDDMTPGQRFSLAMSALAQRARRTSTPVVPQRNQSATTNGPGLSTEMTNMESPSQTIVERVSETSEATANASAPPDDVQREGTSARRAWRRERLARAQQNDFAARARVSEDTRPKWRRIVGRILPILD